MPGDILATIALPASSVILGFLFPLAAGMTILGIIRGLVDSEWRMLIAGLLLAVGLVALGVFLRTWGTSLVTPDELAAVNRTASLVFTTVTPWGVIAGVVTVVVGLVQRYIGGALRRRRGADD